MAALALSAGGTSFWLFGKQSARQEQTNTVKNKGVLAAIGNTPLLEIESLSRATGCRILAKAENMNPGGSVKDRAALWLIRDAEKRGALQTGGTICEGTGGNTGIGLALVAAASGYHAKLAMPESIASEKIELMRTLGAEVHLCPGVPFTDERHYFHVAARLGDLPGHCCVSQFENVANSKSHYESTGPEILRQAGPAGIDAFICASGTGGTIGGLAAFFSEVSPTTKLFLIDPPGSGLYDAVVSNCAGDPFGKEGECMGKAITWLPRSAGSSITEGIGIGRQTANFSQALPLLHGALKGTDQEAIDMAYHLLRADGIFVGPSAALNVAGAYRLAKELGPGKTIVTILCDGGQRYRSKMYSESWLKERGLMPKALEL